MNQAQIYSLKVWLTMVLFAPVLQMSSNAIVFNLTTSTREYVVAYPLSVGIVLLCTLPVGLLLILTISKLSKNIKPILLKRWTTLIISTLTTLTFLVCIAPKDAYPPLVLLMLLLPYSLPLILGIWIFKLDDDDDEELAS